ncbi:DUF6351 family protein [Alishewanella longhuensis]
MFRKILLLFISILMLGLFYFWPRTTYPPDFIEPHPVLAVPDSSAGQLLQVTRFIAQTPRPEDPFAYPIPLGAVGPEIPLYSGSLQYPFYCGFSQQGIEPPLIDNQLGYGIAIYNDLQQITGYSKDCQHPSRLLWFKLTADNQVVPYQGETLAATEQIIRVELGTLLRFFYYIVMPVAPTEYADRTSATLWNQQLIYQFHGGVGIGYRQGSINLPRLIGNRAAQLRQGYAVLSSSANRTSHTYHFLRAEEVAVRLKKHFESLYGKPRFTIGIGGSGGGIAQYLLAQNAPGLLDAAIAQYSYPDMLSQVVYALDCDLLHNYYYFSASDKTFWQQMANRQAVEGLSTSETQQVRFRWQISAAQVLNGYWPTPAQGASQCINAWFGLSSMIHNPHQGRLTPFTVPALRQSTHWSYWQDLVEIYGTDQHGFAHSLWDNSGVQYGLNALRQGDLNPTQFLELNARIGSWLPASQMQAEQIRFIRPLQLPLWLSSFGRHNIAEPQQKDNMLLAPRYRANTAAMTQAYRYGQLFLGKLQIPVIDLRHYLDPVLDMHHLEPSFMVRARLAQHGNAEWQQIWVSHPDYTPETEAFMAIEQWLISGSQPESATDRCFNAEGQVIASGPKVWQAQGSCSQQYPPLSNSRRQAGAPLHGLMMQCQLMPVSQALARGDYFPIDMSSYLGQLERIFPQGVCDYQQADLAYPTDW